MIKKKDIPAYEEDSNEEAEEDFVELPGFYWDPVKKKYFKVQKNSYGVQSSVTNDSIQNSKKLTEQKVSTTKTAGQNLIQILFDCQNGFDHKLRQAFNDFKINSAKPRKLVSFGQIYGNELKEIQFFNLNKTKESNEIYLLTNFHQNEEHLARIFKIDPKNLTQIAKSSEVTSEIELNQIQLNNPNSFSEEFKTSSTKAQIFNENYLMRSFVSSNFSILYIYNLINVPGQLNEITCLPKMKKDYTSDLWCSSLNSDENSTNQLRKCAIGFSNHAQVDYIEKNVGTQKLNTKKSCVYCIKFKPSVKSLFLKIKISNIDIFIIFVLVSILYRTCTALGFQTLPYHVVFFY